MIKETKNTVFNSIKQVKQCSKIFLFVFFYYLLVNLEIVQTEEINPDKNINANKNEQINEKKIFKIEIEGIQNHSPEIVLNTISIHKGDFVSRQTIRSDINKLYQLGFFTDIQVKTTDLEEGILLIFIIKENPVLHNIEFIGNENISNKELKEELDKMSACEKMPLGIGYSEGKETATLNRIIDYYRTKGFFYVSANVEKELDGQLNRIIIRFIIDEGSKKEVVIKKINFKGNNAFSGFRLRRQMETKAYIFILEDGYYKEEIFKGDLKKIIDFYKERGYVNAKVLKHSIDFDKKGRMLIEIELYEGSQYTFYEAKIKGNTIFSSPEILPVLSVKSDEIYNYKKIDESINAITSKYGEHGYIYAQVKPDETIDEEKRTVSILFTIHENTQMYLNNIIFNGNDVTKDKVIRRELTIFPGEIFNTKKVRRSVERVYNLGFFEDVNIDTETGNRDDNLNLKLRLKEKPTGQASFGATYSGTDGLIGQIQIAKNNLFGYGQRVDVTWEFGKDLQNYELGFTDPYILDTKFLFGFNIFNTIRSRRGYDYFGERNADGYVELIKKQTAYEYRKKGIGLRIGRPLSENLRFSIYYNYEDGEYRSIGDTRIPHDVILGENLTRSMTPVLVYDNRDNVFNPTKGVKYSLSFEKAGGFLNGDNNYHKVISDTFWYQRTFSKFVFMIHTQLGVVDHYSPSDDVPPIEKFSIGGGSTVRGYSERGIADRKKREFYVNLEHSYPLEQNINFVIFIDSGNAWDRTQEIRLKDLKSGAGLGFHLETPIGPLRLDYGWGLNLEPGDEKGRFHFNLGWGFF